MFGKKIILASASPRRKELMLGMDISFSVDSGTDFKESVPRDIAPEKVPEYLAEQKSLHFHRKLKPGEILVSADTVVICDGKVMGKPRHRSTALEMLNWLSGKTHKVVSAVCVRNSSKCIIESDEAFVTFKELTDQEIEHYVKKYLPLDKAGAYGIQEWIGMIGVSRIEGSFYTIMGLPTHLLHSILSNF